MMPYDLPILPDFPGAGTGESNYGSAPYAEAAQRAQMRLGLRDRLLAGLSGLSAVPRGANFGTAFLAAAGGSARATWAAKQAAMNYAQRQMDQEQRDADRAALQADREARTKTYTENSAAYRDHLLKLEEHAAKQKDPVAEAERILGRPLTPEERAKKAGVYIAPKAPGKGPAAVKPPKPRAAVMKRIDAINGADPNDPNQRTILQRIIANPPTPEEKAAAERKLMIREGYYRR